MTAATPPASLLTMLTYARPEGSLAQRAFTRRFLLTLPGAWQDAWGNIRLCIGTRPRVLWSSHTDTVHRRDGRQSPRVVGDRILAPRGADCLGADCAAGVWLMREMALARVPGLYIWHAGEECGCIGSHAIAHRDPGALRGIDIAIALDRRGTGDIVTHQWGGRTASDACAHVLARRLARAGLHYRPAHGLLTDTAIYADLVPECTNISTGVAGEHTPKEGLDWRHLLRLRRALIALDAETLPAYRIPTAAWCGGGSQEKDYGHYR